MVEMRYKKGGFAVKMGELPVRDDGVGSRM